MNLKFTSPFFIGIGGSGMSPLAHILLDFGYQVFGSDKSSDSSVLEKLKERKAKIFSTIENLNLSTIDAIIYSTAIDRSTNPIYLKLKEKNLPEFHRSEILHNIFKTKKSIAVAGSHGKTSTTAMIAQILLENGLDPTVMIGGEVSFLGGRGGRWGEGEWGVYESDESDGTFLNSSPEVKIVTNIDNDHLDYYKTFENLKLNFARFIENNENSKSVVCLSDSGVSETMKLIPDKAGILGYSDKNESDSSQVNFSIEKDILHFQKNNTKYQVVLPFKGEHYLKNSLAAILASEIAGVSIEDSINTLKKYLGVKRRLEFIGNTHGIQVFDDYGHHPTEILSVIQSVKQMKGKDSRCVILFQPHRFTRTKELYKEFSLALSESDFVFLLPIYSAGEEEIEGVTSALIFENSLDLRKIYPLTGDLTLDIEILIKFLKKDDILVTLGAGNVRKWGELFLQKKQKEKSSSI
ncbi:MAG: UDP-N-acetylmuramate--L-alanine ligase [Leptospiraceae bacterium]|nr:UDP-N-acetylmuramate--L-alanine ligase [Leptospiraceae bacterium]MCK6379682.1 UDP-N-acetylmuramate--L-alanine ligase [Leptospiraceae bacterium]NUM41766.1 UDP-N-acetylmuramate--L-alanine ligase [Leptospiraceae bacterium]